LSAFGWRAVTQQIQTSDFAVTHHQLGDRIIAVPERNYREGQSQVLTKVMIA